jgi:hypothetical protein
MLGGMISDLEAGDEFEPLRYTVTSLMTAEYAHGVEELVVSGRILERYVKRDRVYLHYQIEVHTADGRLVTEYTDRTLLKYRPGALS